MARKKLRKVLAWTLAATIAVSPVNMTWASESADLFSDSSENVESVEIPADETDSQQGEVDTQSIVSSGEEDEDAFFAASLICTAGACAIASRRILAVSSKSALPSKALCAVISISGATPKRDLRKFCAFGMCGSSSALPLAGR